MRLCECARGLAEFAPEYPGEIIMVAIATKPGNLAKLFIRIKKLAAPHERFCVFQANQVNICGASRSTDCEERLQLAQRHAGFSGHFGSRKIWIGVAVSDDVADALERGIGECRGIKAGFEQRPDEIKDHALHLTPGPARQIGAFISVENYLLERAAYGGSTRSEEAALQIQPHMRHHSRAWQGEIKVKAAITDEDRGAARIEQDSIARTKRGDAIILQDGRGATSLKAHMVVIDAIRSEVFIVPPDAIDMARIVPVLVRGQLKTVYA